jgi:hypothetical protein
VSLPNLVPPGTEVDVSVPMTAPKELKSYYSSWKLKDDKGNIFGIGPAADGYFIVSIQVSEKENPVSSASSTDVYILTSNVCSASWFSSKGLLSCPGQSSEENGSISLVNSVSMEGDVQANLPSLVTIPDSGTGGKISGQFPAFSVMQGDRFRARIGCLSGYPACDVTFQLSFKGSDGVVHVLGSWGHTLDAYIDDLDVSLDSAAGMDAELILTVTNNGNSKDDRAFWVYPRIARP